MATRRAVLAGLFATGLAPRASWADVGNPTYLTAALRPDGIYTLCGIDQSGGLTFELPLPARGHAAAAHPSLPHAVAFARRPGTFAMVIDCTTGQQIARLTAPQGRHFYGHGTFSADGMVLYTSENDFEAARGVIGLWDATNGYTRITEIASGGIGPHDITRLPGTDTLVVANGGIETHPDTGRAKLNLPTMRPNLSYVTPDGTLLDQVSLAPEYSLNSIRHLDVSPAGEVAFAMQWQGDTMQFPALLALHRRRAPPRLLMAPAPVHAALQGYAGSVSFSADDRAVAITSPRGGVIHQFSVADGTFQSETRAMDVCGLSRGTHIGFIYTSGEGRIGHLASTGSAPPRQHTRSFDNHIVRIT